MKRYLDLKETVILSNMVKVSYFSIFTKTWPCEPNSSPLPHPRPWRSLMQAKGPIVGLWRQLGGRGPVLLCCIWITNRLSTFIVKSIFFLFGSSVSPLLIYWVSNIIGNHVYMCSLHRFWFSLRAGSFLKCFGLLAIYFPCYKPNNARKVGFILVLLVLQKEGLQECILLHIVRNRCLCS